MHFDDVICDPEQNEMPISLQKSLLIILQELFLASLLPVEDKKGCRGQDASQNEAHHQRYEKRIFRASRSCAHDQRNHAKYERS